MSFAKRHRSSAIILIARAAFPSTNDLARKSCITSAPGRRCPAFSWSCSPYIDALATAGATISMEGRSRPCDNTFVERLWRSAKYEEVYLHDYSNPAEAWRGLERYFAFYNLERLHQSLAYQPPAAVYFGCPKTVPPEEAGGAVVSPAPFEGHSYLKNPSIPSERRKHLIETHESH